MILYAYMDNHADRFTWYIPQRSTESEGLSSVDDFKYCVFNLEFHDWGVCPKFSFPMLSYPCSLWLFLLEKREGKLE